MAGVNHRAQHALILACIILLLNAACLFVLRRAEPECVKMTCTRTG